MMKIWQFALIIFLFGVIAGCSGGGGGVGSNSGMVGQVSTPTPTSSSFNAALTATIVSAPTPLEGQDFQDVLDENPNDYASSDDPLPCTLLIGLGQQLVVSKIDIIWGSEKCFGIDYTLYDSDFTGRKFAEIDKIRGASGALQTVSLSKPSHSAFLRLDIEKTTGNPEVMIRQIRIWAEYEDDIIAEIMNSNDESIYMEPEDPDNPLHLFRLPITGKMKRLSDALLKEKAAMTDHQKVMRFMTFKNDFKIGIASNDKPETTVKERIGACGTFSNLLLALTTSQGIPGRYVNLYNYPQNYGHSVTELNINDTWRIYDPTFALYYTTTPYNEENPEVLSFDELRAGRGDDHDIYRIVKNPNILESPFVVPDFMGPDIYVKADPAGVIGPDKPMTFPLFLDLIDKPGISGGEIFSTHNQGASHIGAAYSCNEHLWSLSSLQVGSTYRMSIVPAWIGGDLPVSNPLFEAKADIENNTGNLLSGGDYNIYTAASKLRLSVELFLVSSEGQSTFSYNNQGFFPHSLFPQTMDSFPSTRETYPTWEILFTALSEVVKIKISHPFRGPKYRYLVLKECRLETD